MIRKVKKALSIPVVGNGGIAGPEDAEAMVKATGCDGVMIGRAAIGNPFIFRQMNDYFSEGSYEIPTVKDRLETLERFLRYSRKEPVSVVRFQAVQFVLGVPGGAEIRKRIAGAESRSDIKSAMEALREKCE
jgi:tRNA-dihydrouridine synthase